MSVRLKHLASLKVASAEGAERPFVALEDIKGGLGALVDGSVMKARNGTEVGGALGEPGDVLFGKLRPYLAKSWLVDRPAIASTELLCLRPGPELKSRWLGYLVQSTVWLHWAVATSEGTKMPRTSWEKLREFSVAVPPLDEQRAIADYLDTETQRIDQLVNKKEAMIALLEEREKRLILEAVQGDWLDSNMERTSNVPLGFERLPEEWPVRAVWTLFRSGRGRVLSHEDIQANSGPYPVFSSQTADDGCMGSIDTYDFDGQYLTWTTDGANAGTVFYREGKFNCTNVCGTLKAREEMDYRFMRRVLSVVTSAFVRQDINPKLMNDVMLSIRVPSPPPDTQRAISMELESELLKIEKIRDFVRSQIQLLREKRGALITAAVTGELEIPGVAA